LKKAFNEAGFKGKIALILGTWFGSGLAPVAPGTSGTLAGLPVVLLMGRMETIEAALFALFFLVVSIWAAGISCRTLENDDPPAVVIDEVAGFLLALFLLPLTWTHLCVGFFLFRLFDVWKPFPIRNLERLKGGLGVVADDLLAGIYANLALRLLFFFFCRGGS